eukprot:1195470-Prorocentrum_minimum.AAC.3
MATWLSAFTARFLSACAARVFPSTFPVRSSCTSSSTNAPAFTIATQWASLCLVSCISSARALHRPSRPNPLLVRTSSTRHWMRTAASSRLSSASSAVRQQSASAPFASK